MTRRIQFELGGDHGLICCFLLRPQGAFEILDWNDAAEAFNSAQFPIWLHFNLCDTRALKWISANKRIPEEARELLLSSDPRIHMEVVEKGLMSVIGDLHYEFDTDPDALGAIRMYVDQSCLITGRRHSLKAIDRLRLDLIDGAYIETPIQLVVHLVENLTELFATVVEDRSDAVDDIEDLILKETFQEQRSELGRVRRLLARLHRQLRANRLALFRLLARLPSWCSDDKADLQQNVERLEGVVQDLELVQERARLLQEEIAGRLEEAVNRNLYVLSTVTTVFLPITLISGIFGMNVGGLPLTRDNFGFGWVIFAMVLTIGVTLLILQRQKFLAQ